MVKFGVFCVTIAIAISVRNCVCKPQNAIKPFQQPVEQVFQPQPTAQISQPQQMGPCIGCGGNEEIGQWTIHFGRGRAMTDAHGSPCDFIQQCDSYLKIIVNGEEVWRSHTEWGESDPNYQETFTMRGLNKYANIEIQMWDNDVSNRDDLMSEWSNHSVLSLSQRSYLGSHGWGSSDQNNVHIKTQWTPIYNFG